MATHIDPDQLTFPDDDDLDQLVTVPAGFLTTIRAFLTVLSTMEDPAARHAVLEGLASTAGDMTSASAALANPPAQAGDRRRLPATLDADSPAATAADYHAARAEGFAEGITWAYELESGDDHGINDQIRAHIRAYGIRQWRLADMAGLSADALSNRLTGNVTWSITDAVHISQAGVNLGVPMPTITTED